MNRNAPEKGYELDGNYDRTRLFRSVERIVVKVGTHVLSRDDNLLDEAFIGHLMDQVAHVRAQGVEVSIVSSGAVGAGMGSLGMRERPAELDLLQALAAVGQSELMHHYELAATRHGIRVAQVLLTAADLSRKSGYIHVQNALRALFRLGAVPVVNENDSVAVEELRFGDNDTLSAHVANLTGADVLVILTDIDGLYEGPPEREPPPPLIRTVYRITRAVERFCGHGSGKLGIGGMRTKVQAAKMCAASGVATVIAHGRKATLPEILSGAQVGTLFLPQMDRTRGHRRWILARKLAGSLVVDDGAARALIERHTSLLPSGVRHVRGRFSPGDAVSIERADGSEIARGIVAYSSGDVKKLAGHHTREIFSLLGYHGSEEIVHRDNMVMMVNEH